MEEADLDKVASYLLAKKRISCFKNKPSAPDYDENLADQFISMEEYCVNKKSKRVFEIYLLETLGEWENKRAELNAFRKHERKLEMDLMIAKYHLTKEKLTRLRAALTEDFIRQSSHRSAGADKMKNSLLEAFKTLVTATKKSVDEKGNLLSPKIDEILKLHSRKSMKNEKFFEHLSETSKPRSDFIFFDSSVLQDESPLETSFYNPFLRKVKEMGKDTHVFVHILDPIESIYMIRELMAIPGYFPLTTTYVQTGVCETLEQPLFNSPEDFTYTVTYAFFHSEFVQSSTRVKVQEAIKKKLMARGSLMHFDEKVEDLGARSVPFEKSISFFQYLTKLFVDSGHRTICFGEGRNLIQCLLVRIPIRKRSHSVIYELIISMIYLLTLKTFKLI